MFLTDKDFFTKRLRLAALAALMVFAMPHGAQAQVAGSSCDPEYMEALEARAWLEAQREVSMNASIIAKPDSVLEYTCFGNFLKDISSKEANMFSEAGCCGDVNGLGDDSLDKALNDVVMLSVNRYLDTNFALPNKEGTETIPTTALGGRFSGAASPPSASLNGGRTHPCINMQTIWRTAECSNFLQDDPDVLKVARFFDFDFLAREGGDPRKYPAVCPAPAPALVAMKVPTAYNVISVDAAMPYTKPGDPTNSGYAEDPPGGDVFWNTMRGLTAAGTCAPPICTGVNIMDVQGKTAVHGDAVCPNPGCVYTGSGCTNGTSTAAGTCAVVKP